MSSALGDVVVRNLKSILVVLLAVMLIATACSSSENPEAAAQTDATNPVTPADNTDGTSGGSSVDASNGLALVSEPAEAVGITLREGSPVAQVADTEPVPTVEGEPLDEGRVADVIDRLPEWTEDPDDQVDFERPPQTPPPATAITRIDTNFPAGGNDVAPEVVTGPLEVLRFQPEGPIAIAPFISVTFNQPMVPIGTVGQVEREDVPISITPDVAGHWEWIGTRTVRFESDSELFDRLPMATKYTVSIPAGTESASGNTLANAVDWSFETAPPSVTWLNPRNDAIGLEPVFVALFDQPIEPAAVLPVISLTADGDERSIRLATAAEVEADEIAGRRVASLDDGRWLAFTPTEPLPKDSALVVTVGPGTPSPEGPETNPAVETFTGRTYAPLTINQWDCGNRCRPLGSFHIGFNNQLDDTTFDESMVSVEPEIPNMDIRQGGNSISIRGATAGDTKYTVTISGEVADIFGQTLGEDETHTFDVGNADPFLGSFDRGLLVVDPMADNPTLTLPVINHDKLRLRVHQVSPSNWDAFRNFQESLWGDEPANPPGRELADTEIDVDAEDDVLSFIDVALGEYFTGRPGQLVVTISPTGRLANLDRDDDEFWANRPTTVWAQSTNIGLDAFADTDDIIVWTTALDTGKPLAGATVTLVSDAGNVTLTTGADGTARAKLPKTSIRIEASLGNDLVWLDRGFAEGRLSNEIRWHVLDDRGIYRPGETVRMKGWVRELTLTSDAQIALLDNSTEVTWSVRGAQGNELATGASAVSPLGGFDLEFDIADGANLGQAVVEIRLPSGAQTNHVLQVQEFRRPEFEVSARNETVGPFFTAEPATVAVGAAYFSGGPLPNAPVDWTVTTQSSTYRPPNWDDFTFGRWIPWWYGGFDDGGFDCCGETPGVVEQFSGTTNGSGEHYLEMAFNGAQLDGPSTVTANAAVSDVNRQVWSANTSLLVHSGRHYVGLQGKKTFVRKGEPLEIAAIVTDIDGNTVAGKSLDVVAEVLEWKRVDGEWVEAAVSAETCSITSADEAQSCRFGTDRGGRYRISAVVTDDDGGQNRTEMTRWISGGKGKPNTRVEREEAEVIPDKEIYQPGDTAEILVQSPFGPAEGLLLVTRNGIEETRRFTIDEDTAVLSIPIDSSQIPNLNVLVELTGTAPRLDDEGEPIAGAVDRPAYASGSLNLRIPPTTRTLDVVATPQVDVVEPGTETSVDVTVLDADGQPVSDAELLLVVVDEAVLSLTDYQLADPIETFYRDLRSNVSAAQTRQLIRLTNSDILADGERVTATSGDEATAEADDAMEDSGDAVAVPSIARKSGASDEPIDVRSNFDALAVFEPELVTGADGRATMTFTMPDNLTRYRIMAVAVANEDTFGTGEANITARLPLQVRPSAPRFLNFGDEFELPVVVQNQTDETMEVEVILQASNLDVVGSPGQLVTVPANDRIEVRFPVKANEAGTARFRVAAVSGDHADAATVALPVYTPATSEAFATYGVVDSGSVFQPLLGPEAVWPQFGGLEISTSSTALQSLTDAVIYVNEYPFTSSDSAASQILSIASLRDVLSAFDVDGMPTEAEMDASVRENIDAIVGLQNNDGGFPYWSRNRVSVPYNSTHVAHALVVAKAAGYDVPERTLNRSIVYLRNIEQSFPPTYSQISRDTITAYSLNVRSLWGERDSAQAEAIYNRSGEELSLDALAWLWPVVDSSTIDQGIERELNNRTTETAAGASFVNSYSDDDYVLLHSNRRTDGIVLDALISQRPTSDLIPKVVQGLLAGKTKGRWRNLQENTFILLALNTYFDEFESADPDFVAQVWLGDTYAAEHTYAGRSTDQNETLVPMSVLLDEGDTDIVLRKDGTGRLYYRLGLSYAPQSLELDPLDRGFVVQRTYEGVDDPDDVWLDDDGVWHVKAGAEVRVKLTMIADSRRTHVALVDPLPAGLEILNPALATTEALPVAEGTRGGWWWSQWFNHQNLRDDRAEAFTNYLWAGTYDYSYIARATTPGTFVVPPTKAEEMYTPETFGRSGSDVLIVEADSRR